MVSAISRAARSVCGVAVMVLAGVLGTSGLWPVIAAPSPTTVGVGTSYLALGDSLTTGTEAEANNDGKPGYPTYLYDLIKGSSALQGTILGKDGETTSSMLAPGGQLDAALAFIATERTAGRVVSPVTLDIGGNDMVAVLQGGTNVNTALMIFRANLGVILDSLVDALTVNGQRTGDLVIMTYYNPYPGVKLSPPIAPFEIDTDRDVARFNAVIVEEATKRNIAVAPVFEAFRNPQQKLVFADFSKYNPFKPVSDPANQVALDYHPTEAGHKAIAATFRQTLGYASATKTTIYLPTVLR